MHKNYLIPILVSVFIITIALIPSQLSDAQTSKSSAPTLTIGATSPATTNIGTDPMKITVTWSDSSGTKWEVRKDGVLAQTVTSRTATFNSLEKNVSHCFTVKRILPSPGLLESDKKCSAVQSAISSLTQTGLTQVKIAWTQTAATAPSQSLTSASNFKVERVLSPGQTKQVCSTGNPACSSTFIQMTPLTAVSHTDNTVVAGSEYCYEIQATWPSPRSHSMDSDRMCIKLDNTPPVISYTVTPSSLPTGSNEWYTDSPKVTWTVTENESPTTVIKTGCIDTTFDLDTPTLGTTLTCSATSVGGASATTSVTIKRDATKPLITLTGADPLYLRDNGVAFTDPGAIITDATSGPAGPVVATNNVDTSTAEVYSRVYNGKDLAGNDAVAVTGIVDVVSVVLDTSHGFYITGDNVYVKVIDFLAWNNQGIPTIPVSVNSLYLSNGNTLTRELISNLALQKREGSGVFSNIDPVTLVLNDDCLTEIDPNTLLPICQEPLLSVEIDDDVVASYLTFDTAKIRIGTSDSAGLGVPPRTTDTIRFVESDRYPLGGSATIKVNDTARAGSSSVSVKITSTQDPTGFDITLNPAGGIGKFISPTLVTFTSGASSAPAIKAAVGDTVTATYVASGSLGTLTAAAVIVASDNVAFTGGVAVDIARRDSCSADVDGDAICDSWETSSGLRIPTTVSGVDFFIPCTSGATMSTDLTGKTVCPSTSQKDLYLEVDSMLGHTANTNSLNDAGIALKAIPIKGISTGAVNGIALHTFVDDSTIPHQTLLPFEAGAGVTSFKSLKLSYFGTASERGDPNAAELLTAKRQVFHWALIGHSQTEDKLSSGKGEQPGNDFWISMGEFTGKTGTRGQRAATILHELGHNLNLDHGGGDKDNCKSNYLSVMNYLFQFDLPDGGFVSGRPLAYSYYKFTNITETALREDIASITSQAGKKTIIGGAALTGGAIVPFTPFLTDTNLIIDWNQNGATAGSYPRDTNYFAALVDCQVLSGATLFTNGVVTITQGANTATATFTNSGAAGIDSGAELTAFGGAAASITNGAVTITQGANTATATFTNVAPAGLNLGTELTAISNPPKLSNLAGYNDGANLAFNFRFQGTYDSGASVINQVHTYSSTDGTVNTDEFDTTIEVPDIYLIQSGNEGTSGFSGSGTYTDPDADTIIGTIDWGDGTSSDLSNIVLVPDVGATFSFGPHTYADDNPSVTSSDPYPITVKITATRTDAGLHVYSYDSTIAGTFTVNNVAPAISITNNGPVSEGNLALISVAVTDVPADIISYSFDCNNDTVFEIAPQASNSASCPAPDNPSITVGVLVSDDDGGSTPGSTTVIVNNVAPAISSVTGPVSVSEGSLALISVAATDVPADTISYSFDCNNDTVFEIAPQASNSASCPAPDNPSITVGVIVSDEDGGSTPGSTTVTVNNVAPVITSVTNNGPVNAGSSATITVAATDVPADTIKYSFDCANDGTFEIAPQASGSALCLAPTAPSLTVGVQASDEDGGVSPTSTTTVTVNPVVTFSVTFTKIHSGDTISKKANPKHLDIEWIVKDAAGNIVPPTAATVGTQYTITITPTSPAGATFPGTATAFIKDDVPSTIDYHQPKSALTAGTTYTFNVLRDGIIIGQLTNIKIIT